MVAKSFRPLPEPLNWLAAHYQRSNWPGKYRLWQLSRGLMKRRTIQHHFSETPFEVPWDQWCFWLERGPENYYPNEITPFIEQLNLLNEPFDFIDLGADVGVVSLAVARNCPAVKQITALEPNPFSFKLLERNSKSLSVSGQALNQAISDYCGTATLCFNSSVGSDHEGSIDSKQPGDTQVTTLDQLAQELRLAPGGALALKIDVEGQEQQVFSGGANTIATAQKVLVLLEIHPQVLASNNQSPEELFKAAELIRPFTWLVPAHANQQVDRSRPFNEQFESRQYDVIGISE